jgi:hypothetical protein
LPFVSSLSAFLDHDNLTRQCNLSYLCSDHDHRDAVLTVDDHQHQEGTYCECSVSCMCDWRLARTKQNGENEENPNFVEIRPQNTNSKGNKRSIGSFLTIFLAYCKMTDSSGDRPDPLVSSSKPRVKKNRTLNRVHRERENAGKSRTDNANSGTVWTNVEKKPEYHDHADDREEDYGYRYNDECRTRRAKGGVAETFPLKLHCMLETTHDHGVGHIVFWQLHGRAFKVNKANEFVAQVMPKFFHQSKITSFQRQLNLYGFRRISRGADAGSYYHELFLRERAFLCHQMNRTKIKGTGHRQACSPETEPNFYTMPFVKQIENSRTKRPPCSSPTSPVLSKSACRHHRLYSSGAMQDQQLQELHVTPISPTGSDHTMILSAVVHVPWKPVLPSGVLLSPEVRPAVRVVSGAMLCAQPPDRAICSSADEVSLLQPPRMFDLPVARSYHGTSEISMLSTDISATDPTGRGLQEIDVFSHPHEQDMDVLDIISFEGKQFHYLSTFDLAPRFAEHDRQCRIGSARAVRTQEQEAHRGYDVPTLVIAGNDEEVSAESNQFASDDLSAPELSMLLYSEL